METKLKVKLKEVPPNKQNCPQCGFWMNNVAGAKKSICRNCGFKDPCC